MILNIEKIYHQYLQEVNEKERENIKKMPGYFAMGGAGSCFMKQMLKVEGYEADEVDKKTTRLFRLGALVHDDIEKAIKAIISTQPKSEISIEVTTEKAVVIDELKIRGFYDICVINHKTKLIEMYDIKSIKAFQWKLKYGHIKNRDKNPAVLAELQLASYVLAKLKENIGYTFKMYLIHYKKDDSTIKVKQIDPSFLHSALMYWEEFKEFRSENKIEDIEPGVTFNVPVYQWECNYCNWHKHCSAPYRKKK